MTKVKYFLDSIYKFLLPKCKSSQPGPYVWLSVNIKVFYMYISHIWVNNILRKIVGIKNYSIISLIIFVPYILDIHVTDFLHIFILISLISSFIIFNKRETLIYIFNDSDITMVFEYIWYICSLLSKEIFFLDEFNCVLLFIGLYSLLLNIFIPSDSISLEKILKMFKNIQNNKLGFVLLLLGLWLFTTTILSTSGFGTLNTLSLTAFIFTLFSRFTLLRLIFLIIIFFIKGSLDIKMLSLSSTTLVIFLLLGFFSFLFIIPTVKLYSPILATFIVHKFNYSLTTLKEIFTANNLKYALSSFTSILNSCPLLRSCIRWINLWTTVIDSNRSSIFRLFELNIFKFKKNIMEFSKINKFIPVQFYKFSQVESVMTIKLDYKLSEVISWMKNNSFSIYNKLKNLSCDKYNLDIVCSDYKAQLIYSKGCLKFISDNKNNPFFDCNYFYNHSSKNTDSMSELSLYNKVESHYKSELDFLKYNPTPPKELVNYKVHSLQINTHLDGLGESNEYDEKIEDIFPSNSVIKVVHGEHDLSLYDFYIFCDRKVQAETIDYNHYTDSEKKKLLVDIAKDLYRFFLSTYRFFLDVVPFPNGTKIENLETHQYSLLPDKLYVITRLRDCIDENAIFKYDKINLFIYAMLLDFHTNGQDPLLFPNSHGPALELVCERSRVCWMNVSGIHWMSIKELNLRMRDNPKYLWHTKPSENNLNMSSYALLGKSVPQKPFVNYL